MKRSSLAYVIIGMILVSSLAFAKGNKFDAGERFLLTLLFGLSTAPIFFCFWQRTTKRFFVDTILLLLFLCLLWVSFGLSETKDFGFSEVFVFTSVIGIYLAIASSTHEPPRAFINFLIGLGTASALFAFIYFVTQFEPRAAGFFFDPWRRAHYFPNAFALFLLMIWPLAAWKAYERWNLLRGMAIATLIASLFVTYSRGAWIVFGLQAILLSPIFLQKKTIAKTATIALITVTLIVALIGVRHVRFPIIDVAERTALQNETKQTSVGERMEFFKGSLELSAQKPWFGSGPFSFGFIYPSVQRTFLATSDHPHNWFLKIAVENGIPAALLLLGYFIYLYLTNCRNIKNLDDREKIFAHFLSIALIGGILHNMIDYNFNFLTNALLFWTLLGIYRHYAPEQTTSAPRASIFAIGSILILLTAYEIGVIQKRDYAYSFFPRNYFLEKEVDLVRHTSLNPHDARGWYELGNFYRAVKTDPMNRFLYYYHALAQAQKFNELETYNRLTAQVSPLLEAYESMLEQNLHFTAFTDNPEYAAKIYELFGNYDKASSIRNTASNIKKAVSEKNKLNWNPPFGL